MCFNVFWLVLVPKRVFLCILKFECCTWTTLAGDGRGQPGKEPGTRPGTAGDGWGRPGRRPGGLNY